MSRPRQAHGERPGGLGNFFAPRSIAVVGASAEPSRAGGRVLKILQTLGYGGRLFPVNPKQPTIGGLRCYPALSEIGEDVDLAVICLAAKDVAQAIRECGEAGVKAVVVLADGFASNPALRQELMRALEEARARSGLRMIGPNTVGIRANDTLAYATYASDAENAVVPGPVATIAQSGGLGVYFGAALLRRRGLGSQFVIDVGNEFDVDVAECIEYVSDHPAVSCISVLIEGFADGRRLAEAVRMARGKGKAVVFMKIGRSEAARGQVASHTGALAGKAELFDAAMRAAGAHVAKDESEFMDAVVINGFGRVPAGRRLGVVTPSGGYAIMTIDAADQFGMELPKPSTDPTEAERQELRFGGFGNPLDYSSTISAGPRAVETSLAWMAAQPNIDAVLFWQSFVLERIEQQERVFKALCDITAKSSTPIFCCGVTSAEFEAKLRNLGVLWFQEPTRLVRALSVVAPGPASQREPVSPGASIKPELAVLGEKARSALAEATAIHSVATVTVASVAQAVEQQRALGSDKVILKVESDRILHKTEFGLVSGPLTIHEVEAGFERLATARAACGDPDAPIVLQPFAKGTELALGAFVDPVFGPVAMVAAGGIFLEILKDTAFALAPLSEDEATKLILGLKVAPVLLGARGRPKADIQAAARALSSLSEFIARHEDSYSEIDVNPLIVGEDGHGAVAADIVLVKRG